MEQRAVIVKTSPPLVESAIVNAKTSESEADLVAENEPMPCLPLVSWRGVPPDVGTLKSSS